MCRLRIEKKITYNLQSKHTPHRYISYIVKELWGRTHRFNCIHTYTLERRFVWEKNTTGKKRKKELSKKKMLSPIIIILDFPFDREKKLWGIYITGDFRSWTYVPTIYMYVCFPHAQASEFDFAIPNPFSNFEIPELIYLNP